MKNLWLKNIWKRKRKGLAVFLSTALLITMFPMNIGNKTVKAADNQRTKTPELIELEENTKHYFLQETDPDAIASKNLGSAENPIKITIAQELINLAFLISYDYYNENYVIDGTEQKYASCHYVLENDISLSEYSSWEPIGSENSPFSGTFNGKNHAVTDLYCPIQSSYCGFFGSIENAAIENLTLKNAQLDGTVNAQYEYVGILVGGSYTFDSSNTFDTSIRNCSIDADSKLTYTSDAFTVWTNPVGTDYKKDGRQLSYCSSKFGGIVGGGSVNYFSNFLIENCSNAANIECNGVRDVGGIVGGMFGENEEAVLIDGCINAGEISGNSYVGGMIGYSTISKFNITNCENKSNIAACDWSEETWKTFANSATAEPDASISPAMQWIVKDSNDCYLEDESEDSFVDIFGPGRYAGGIAGFSYGKTFGCNNSGMISGLNNVGGIAGSTLGSTVYCINTGAVEKTKFSSHLITVNYNGKNLKSPDGPEYTIDNYQFSNTGNNFGGIVGSFLSKYELLNTANGYPALDNTNVSISDCGNTGNVSGAVNCGGILGDRNLSGESEINCVKNCYNAGTINGKEKSYSFTENESDVLHSYYLSEKENLDSENIIGKTEEQFQSGEICWLLNAQSDISDDYAKCWRQKIGEMHFPLISHRGTDENDIYCVNKVTYKEISDTAIVTDKTIIKYQNTGDTVCYETQEGYDYEFYLIPEGSLEVSDQVVTSITGDMTIGVKKTAKTPGGDTPKDPDDDTPNVPGDDTPKDPSDDTPNVPDNDSPKDPDENSQNGQIKLPLITPAPGQKGSKVAKKNVEYMVTGGSTVKVNGTMVSKSTASSLTVPDTITIENKKYKVTEIGVAAFANNTKITQIKLGKNVKTLSNRAFKGCKKLKKITFSNKVSTLGEECFANCTKLSKAVLPSSMKKIGNKAFKNCTSLKKLQIGKKSSIKKKGALSKAGNIPQKTETIEEYGALNLKISIGNHAMENCKNLKSVVVNSAVRVIGNSAFKNCVKLSSIIVRSLILKTVGKKALLGVKKCKISVPAKKFKPYKKLFKNKGQGKKVFVAKA